MSERLTTTEEIRDYIKSRLSNEMQSDGKAWLTSRKDEFKKLLELIEVE